MCGQWLKADPPYSADFLLLWDEVVIPIKYGSDYQLARDILLRVLNEGVGDYAKLVWKEVVKV